MKGFGDSDGDFVGLLRTIWSSEEVFFGAMATWEGEEDEDVSSSRAEDGEVLVGEIDGEVEAGRGSMDPTRSREEGARRRKLHSRPRFLQLSHIGCVQSHCSRC